MPKATTVVHSITFEAEGSDNTEWDPDDTYEVLVRIVLEGPTKITVQYSSDEGDYWQTWQNSVGRRVFCRWLQRGLAGSVSNWTAHEVRTVRPGLIEFSLRCGTLVRVDSSTLQEVVTALQA